MKFQFTEKKVSLPESVHAYAEKKVMKLERFFRDDAEALVTFSVEKDRNKAEITVHAAGTYFRASEATSDMYASIDAAVATIERQIRKNKTRLEKKLKAGPIEWTDTGVGPVDEEEDSGDFTIVRTKRFSIKPMTPQEAILQMNLLEHAFYAFLNSEDADAFSVVYRRKSGGYGLISDTEE